MAEMGLVIQIKLVEEWKPEADAHVLDRMTLVVPGHSLAQVEKDVILMTVAHTKGNRTQAACLLGISIRTLRNKLNQYKEESARTLNNGHGGPPHDSHNLRSEDHNGEAEMRKVHSPVQGQQEE